MIVGLSVMLILIGTTFLSLDMFVLVPVELMPTIFMFKFLGVMFIPLGVMLWGGRTIQTGAGMFLDLPNSKHIILLHQRRGRNPNAMFLKGKLEDLDFIRTKGKIFKDTGGGFRISGHDVRRTHEDICHDIPEWLGQYFHQIRNKYGVSNIDDLNSLYESLKKLNAEEDAEDQLSGIKLLAPILQDEKKKSF